MTNFDLVESVFFAALQLAPADRLAFLDESCRGKPELRERVERLLVVKQEIGGFLEPPAVPGAVTSGPAAGTANFPGKDEHVGAIIAGKYKLIEEIGEGGMGSVYMAQQTEPVRRAVAVKVIKAGMDSKAVLARFEAERQALAMMDHPNIARVLDAGTTASGRPYFVMELVKGVPITQFCDERKLTPRQRLELFVPVCQAIQHAHQKGVIHRDIKPSNVLVALYDDKPVPKVIDFGVAKAAGQSLTEKTLMTGFGAVVGTPEYMSPEQANLNNLDIDTRSDVYSLGVLLYELLTGSTPVDKKSIGKAALMEVLRIVREVDAPRPSVKLSTSDALPNVAAARGTEPAKLSNLMKGELDWVLLKALDKDRARRYETANGLAADIQRYLANEAVVARPPSTAYRLQKTWQRNKIVFLTGTAIAASLVIGIAVSISQATRAEREATRAVAALDELRATAPAFAEQARVLAAKDQFDEAIEKLDYATKLCPDVPDYLIAKGDLLQCQFRLSHAAAAYRAALALSPDDARAKASAELCDELLAAPLGQDRKLTRESLSKLHLAMQQQQRPAAELMPVARLLGEENKLLVAYWLERLKSLPISADKPLAQRLTVRDDGLLALDLSETKVSDLTPLAGAPLAVLNAAGASKLTGISPLRGMNLIELNLARTRVFNIKPLEKMTCLETLNLNFTQVSDLAPLKGLRLKNVNISGCGFVRSIASLRGAALEVLDMSATRVTDLSPLVGMPLKYLDLGGVPATDFKPLAGLPLEICNFSGCQLTDLAVLRGMPLRELMLWNCSSARNYGVIAEIKTLELLVLPNTYLTLPEEDLAAIASLRGHPKLCQLGAETMPGLDHTTTRSKEVFWQEWDRESLLFQLQSALRKNEFRYSFSKFPNGTFKVSIEQRPMSDLSFLKGFPIGELWIGDCNVTDLTPIQDLPLRVLGIYGNPIADLSPLRKLPLVELSIERTNVSDLSPLTGLRLTKLYADHCDKLNDVSPLAQIPTLVKLTVPAHARNIEKLRKLPNLKWLAFGYSNTSPWLPVTTANEFWKDFDNQGWVQTLRDAGFTNVSRQQDGTWKVVLENSAFSDLTILKGAPIRSLWLGNTAVSDLEPLRGMQLKELRLYHTKVTDLSPIKGMPIDYLHLSGTKITDISALRGMPLRELRLHDCSELLDVSPLAESKSLVWLTLPPNVKNDAKNVEAIRPLPKLERLGFIEEASKGWRPDKTTSEFWREFDAMKK